MITFRKAQFSDCEQFNRWENDEEIIRFLSIEKNRSMETTIRELIARENDESIFDFVVLYQDEPIGRAYLSRYDKKSSAIDITRVYIGEPSLHGKGLGRAMMEALLEFCFGELQLNRVTLDYYDNNPAEHLYRSLGFLSEGVAREAGRKDGVYYNFNLMSLLRREWSTSRKA